jgi:hypothetical protein
VSPSPLQHLRSSFFSGTFRQTASPRHHRQAGRRAAATPPPRHHGGERGALASGDIGGGDHDDQAGGALISESRPAGAHQGEVDESPTLGGA